jgi:hypothetical protein
MEIELLEEEKCLLVEVLSCLSNVTDWQEVSNTQLVKGIVVIKDDASTLQLFRSLLDKLVS